MTKWDDACADAVRRWIADECVTSPVCTALSGDLFRSFKQWIQVQGGDGPLWSRTRFTMLIHAEGFGSKKSNGKRYLFGIKLKNIPKADAGTTDT